MRYTIKISKKKFKRRTRYRKGGTGQSDYQEISDLLSEFHFKHDPRGTKKYEYLNSLFRNNISLNMMKKIKVSYHEERPDDVERTINQYIKGHEFGDPFNIFNNKMINYLLDMFQKEPKNWKESYKSISHTSLKMPPALDELFLYTVVNGIEGTDGVRLFKSVLIYSLHKAKRLDDFLKKQKITFDKDILLYKGISKDSSFPVDEANPKFFSTSFRIEVANEFTSVGGKLMVIRVRAGTPIPASCIQVIDESELLISRDLNVNTVTKFPIPDLREKQDVTIEFYEYDSTRKNHDWEWIIDNIWDGNYEFFKSISSFNHKRVIDEKILEQLPEIFEQSEEFLDLLQEEEKKYKKDLGLNSFRNERSRNRS